MDYAVRRLALGDLPNYHLLDESGTVLMVADQTVAPKVDERRQVRLARPDGKLLAVLDLPQTSTTEGQGVESADYAIIYDYAVYAILSVHHRSDVAEEMAATYFTLEVEGEKWLALWHAEEDNCYALYDQIPGNIHTYRNVAELELPPSIGRICRGEEKVAYTVTLNPGRLRHTGMVVLALAFLIDSHNGEG